VKPRWRLKGEEGGGERGDRMHRGAQGSLLKIIPIRARDPPQNPPTSSPFDSPSIKRGLLDPPWIQLKIKIIPARPVLSDAFVIIEFRDMLIKSARLLGAVAPRLQPRKFFSFSASLCYAVVGSISSIWRTVGLRSLRITLTNAHETSITSHRFAAPSVFRVRRDAQWTDGRSWLCYEFVRDIPLISSDVVIYILLIGSMDTLYPSLSLSSQIFANSHYFWVNFRKAHTSDFFEIMYILMYWLRIWVKIDATFIFMVKTIKKSPKIDVFWIYFIKKMENSKNVSNKSYRSLRNMHFMSYLFLPYK